MGVRGPIAAAIVAVVMLGIGAEAAHAQALSVADVTETDQGDPGQRTEGTGLPSRTMTFRVVLSQPAGNTVTVNYATQNITATAPADYTTATGTLTFIPGDTDETVVVTIVGDAVNEHAEEFRLQLSNAAGASIDDGTSKATIPDDDAPPFVKVSDGVIPNPGVEGTNGNRIMEFSVRLVDGAGADVPSGKTVTVQYETQTTGTGSGHAEGAPNNTDYQHKAETLTFQAGTVARTIQVVLIGDSLREPNETFKVVLLPAPGNAVLDEHSEGLGTIVDDDTVVGVADVVTAEGSPGIPGAAVFTVTVDQPGDIDVVVGYSTANGSATASGDFIPGAPGASITIAAGTASGQITIPLVGDTLDENDETFLLNLAGTFSGDKSATATIADDDAAPGVSVADANIPEGGGIVTFTVQLAAASARSIWVPYATGDLTAKAPADYAAKAGTLTFPAGVTTVTVGVPIAGDPLDEVDETFVLQLGAHESATIADGQGIATITDDDNQPSISIGDDVVAEGSGEPLKFHVSLSAASGRTVTVRYRSSDGDASAPADYEGVSGELTFSPGDRERTVAVTVIGDADVEADESLTLFLLQPSNATIADVAGTGVILNDDVGPPPPPPPAGPVGVSLNAGAKFTNSPFVSVDVVWPGGARELLIDTDGGFRTAGRVAVAASIPVRLPSSGPERLPKTIYVRFDSTEDQTFTDDIILDQTAPRVRSATLSGSRAPRAAAVKRTWRLSLSASDRTSGVRSVELAVDRTRPDRLRAYAKRFMVSAAKAPRWVRVIDGAGNRSAWRTLARPRTKRSVR